MSTLYEDWVDFAHLGPKPAGSKMNEAASQWLEDSLKQEGITSHQHRFDTTVWTLKNFEPLKMVESDQILESYPAVGSSSGNIKQGLIERSGTTNIWHMYQWPRYTVKNHVGKVIAHITARPDGPPLSQTLLETWNYPHLFVGEDTFREWEALINSGKTPTVSFQIETEITKKELINVHGIIKGTNSDLPPLVIGAHFDTMYNTIGAYDNASGTMVLLHLIKHLFDKPIERDIHYVFFNAEELLLAGSKAFVNDFYSEKDSLNIMINIEGMGRGSQVDIWSTNPNKIKNLELLKSNFDSLHQITPPLAGSDHQPFVDVGHPAMMLTVNDQEIIHSRRDVPQSEMVKNMKILYSYLEKITV
ncbi:M28 family metallopeptidase [Alkalicoccus halolimnae]|uniref:M28 family peptidase n=1 Tax=Alkalicoccus halolimnae TaxID=1667239 RepID=A0A5C7F3S0_9BACI|nr:M28 family peptidase [Alkalicoccus halolimnae]TXF85311.1 Zn-dependent exopeptidase M28 [Alkalicoccus halolimnae]